MVWSGTPTELSSLPITDWSRTPALASVFPTAAWFPRFWAPNLPNKVIAAQLNISEHTVKFHINSIMGKLGAQSRTDAVMRATRSGLILL